MGLYTNNLSGGFGGTSFESLEENTSLNIFENMTLMEAAMNCVAITEENWNNFQREIALAELAHVEETGTDFVYTEATGTGFIEKAKEFFKNIWEKIKSLFRKFLVIIGSYSKDDKEFVRKYSKDIAVALKNIPSDATFKGYTYTLKKYVDGVAKDDMGDTAGEALDSGKALASADRTALAALGSNKDYDYGDVMDAVRGEIMGESSGLSASEFSEKIFEMLRNGESSKDDLDMNANLVNHAMGQLQEMKEIKKVAKDAYTKLNKAFNKVDKDLTNYNKTLIKDYPKGSDDEAKNTSDVMTGVNRYLAVTKGVAGCLQTANGIFLTACKEASRQYKAICVKCVTYRNVKESAEYNYNESAEDMFAGVVLR